MEGLLNGINLISRTVILCSIFNRKPYVSQKSVSHILSKSISGMDSNRLGRCSGLGGKEMTKQLNLNKMSKEEFSEYVSKLVDSYTANSVPTAQPRSFIYKGVLFNRHTPKKDWDWLDKEFERLEK